MSLLGPATLALLAEALRVVAADLDQYRAEPLPCSEESTCQEQKVSAEPAKSSNPDRALTEEEVTVLRTQALDIIQATLADAPASTAERVASILGQFNVRRVSELTAVTAPQALEALREAFPAQRGE